MRHVLASTVLAAVTVLAFPAIAQPRDAASADALFRAGREAADHGDFALGRAKFTESQRLDPAPGTLLNIADCEEHLSLLATAWEHFVTAAEQLPRGDDRVAFAQRRITAIERRLPRLKVILSASAPAGTTVTRDGVELAAALLGTPVALDPGAHELVVVAPGHERTSIKVTLKEAEAKAIVLEPGADAALPWPTAKAGEPVPGPAGAGVATPAGADLRGTFGFAVGGVGVAGLGVSLVTGIMAFGAASTFKANCTSSGACNPQGMDAASSGKTLTTISTVSFLVGLAGVGAGTYFLLTRDPAGRPSTALLPAGNGVALWRAF